MIKKDGCKKLMKSGLCLFLSCAIAIGSSAVFPVRTEADGLAGLAGGIAKGVIKTGIKFLDRTAVKLLDKASKESDEIPFELIADLITLPDDKAGRELQKTCDEILSQVKDMRADMNALNQDLDNSIAAIQKTLDKTNLSGVRSQIDRVVADCDNLIESYQTFITYSKAYADKVVAYTNSSEADKAQKKSDMDKAAANVEGALVNFESDAKKADFHTMIERVAQYSCNYYPYYVIGGDPQKLGSKNNGEKVMEYADAYGNDVFAFEHQKYDFLVDIMNSTAYAFTKISWTNRLYADYLESENRLTAAEEQSFIRVMNKVLQGINDVGEQCENYTKDLMRPYDVNVSPPLDFESSKQYREFGNGTMVTLDTTLTAVDTHYDMSFYQVKPIGKPYPFLILKNGLENNGPKTEQHLVKIARAMVDNKHDCEFSTMDMDFYNILQTVEHPNEAQRINGDYKMPATPTDFSYFFSNAFKGVGSDIYRYLSEAGGLDLNKLAPKFTITPLNDWNEAGYQISARYSNYHCHYRVLMIPGFNPVTPNNFKIDRKADKYYYSNMLVVLKGNKDKLRSLANTRLTGGGNGKCDIFDSTGKPVGSSDRFSAGTRLTVKFRPEGDYTGLVLTGNGGKLLETLIDPEMFELLADENNTAEITFSVPYQSTELKSVTASGLDSMLGSSGANSVMSADSIIAIQPEETPLGSADIKPEGVIAAAQGSLTDDFLPGSFEAFGVNLNANAQPQVFTDINGHPLEDDINFTNSWGLLAGTADKKFAPDSPMTRSMIVMILAKLSGADVSSYRSSNFSDVPLKSEFRPYAEWAYKQGIAQGHGNWSFKPDEPVTREQMAVFIVKFAEKAGIPLPTSPGDSGPYNDHESISEWAAEAVYAIRPSGIMKEEDGFLFNPGRAVTKAEGASMVARFIRAIPNN